MSSAALRLAILVGITLFSGVALAQTTTAAAAESRDNPASRVTTAERARQALQIAKLAAKHGMQDLSLRAVRESLAGGPPVQAVEILGSANRSSSSNETDPYREFINEMEQALADLNPLWEEHAFDPLPVYEVLAVVVLPTGRANEIFLYPKSLTTNDRSRPAVSAEPRTVSGLLVDWARRADKLDELEQRVAERAEQPRAKIEALCLLTQIALAKGDPQQTNERLKALAAALGFNSLQHSAELACHVALPAMANPETAEAAMPLVEQVVDNLASTATVNYQMEPASTLLLQLARARFDAGDAQRADQHLNRYLQINQANNSRYSGDYGLYLRQQQLTKVAEELMRGGRIADAFARFGEAADITTTQYRPPGTSDRHVVTIARVLARQPAAERYQTLYDWTMPKPGRQTVRVMTGFVPYEKPPAVFARVADPEHPTPEDAFDVPTFGLAGNVVSTAAILVDAAQQTGKLDALIGELQTHAEQKVENTDVILVLSLLANGRADEAEPLAAPRLEALAEAREKRDRARDAMADFLVALACVGHEQTANEGHELLDEIISYSISLSNRDLMKQAQHVRARAHTRSAAAGVVENARPALWTPGTVAIARFIESGGPAPMWIAHAGTIQHVCGVEGDNLFFRYPLSGEFEFSFDATNTNFADGDVSYGGAVFLLRGGPDQAQITDTGYRDTVKVQHQSAARNEFVRRTLKISPQSTEFAANGVTLLTDEHPPTSSPWLALTSYCHMETTYRNFEIRGQPTIPREVRLSEDPRMRGWVCRYYSERRPPAIEQPEDDAGTTGSARTEEPDWDWWWEDGVIHGVRTTGADGLALPSRLLYHRPLESRDRISWEFFYAHGREAVHPTLGRLAFLIAQDGIRLHWMTTGEEDWTGLPIDNAVSDPASERGNIAGVLREGWNDAVLALHGDTVALTLNDESVFERTLEGHASRQFGLFHFNDRSKARARNIVLTGDWPERLDEHTLARLTEPVRADFPQADGHALHAIIDEERMVADSIDVVRRARALPAEKRYAFLTNWVLPGRDHPTLRMVADATPAHPSPPVMQTSTVLSKPSVDSFDEPDGATKHETGGTLVSPLWELIDVAQELGRLGELRDRVAALDADDNTSRRSRLAALCLIDLAAGEAESAEQALQGLRNELDQMHEFENWQRWPDVAAAARAIEDPGTLPVALDVLEHIVTRQVEEQEQPGERLWNRHVYALRGRAQRRAALLETPGSLTLAASWAPVVHPRSRMRGKGFPMPVWRTTSEGELRHWPGCDDDYLYFPVPLAGDFVLECELTSAKGREMHVGYAGHWFGLDSSREQYRTSAIARTPATHTLDPPVASHGDWDRYKLVVTSETCTTFVNDREIHEQSLPRRRDPWLVLHCDQHSHGGVRNVRILGDPAVPKSLKLLLDDQLTGWSARYFEESAGPIDESRGRNAEKSDWRVENDTLVGRLNPQYQNVPTESLVQYHRPLLEDGVLRYQFRYVPEKELVHPALDRLVFLLDPEQGVRIHWLTDGKFDRTPLGPDNVFDEPQNRLTAALPLHSGEFNELRLELEGDMVELFLNDRPIYRRQLNAANNRLFGLFHDRGQTEARVRDLDYAGEWPATLPDDIRVTSERL